MDTVFDSFPILKNYIYTNNDSEELYETTILPQTMLYVEQRSNLQKNSYFSWDLMSLYVNIYSQYNNTDNVAVIPPFVSVSASNVRKLRIEIRVLKMKLNKKNINDEEREKIESEIKDKMEKKIRLHQTILAATPKAIRDKLFNKRLICYVTNTNDGTHWCCTFVFNIRQYVLNIENRNSLEPSEDIFEIPGYFEFNPLSQPTKYRKTTTKYGLFEYLYIMYEHCWNRPKEIEDRVKKIRLISKQW